MKPRCTSGVISLLAVLLALPAAGQAPQEKERVRIRALGETLGVEVDLPGMEGSLSLTLPELINDATRRLVYTDTNLKRVRWQPEGQGGIRSEWRQEELAAYQLAATPEEGGILLRWKITNLSREKWPDAAGNVCMRSRNVPALFDPTGERIFLRSGGRWVSVRETGTVGSTWYLPPGRDIVPLMKPHIEDGSYRVAAFRPDEAIIAVRSRDGGWVLAQAWQQSRYLLANVHPNYVCTEAPPSFGDIEAGETIEATGKIYLLRGTLDQLESTYRKDVREKKIGLQRGKRPSR